MARIPRPDRNARRRRGRGERGVTMVEYVLFAGCFVLVAVTAVGGLNRGAKTYFSTSSSRIGQPINRVQYDANGQRQALASTTSITAAPATTTIPPTTAAPTTTTTTLPPTTTTTTPPTTSTTTTTIQQRLTLVATDSSYYESYYNWAARAQFTITATGGASVSGVVISATFTRSNGGSASGSCTTNSSGQCSLTWQSMSRSNTSFVDVSITNVSGTAQWTGSASSIRLNRV